MPKTSAWRFKLSGLMTTVNILKFHTLYSVLHLPIFCFLIFFFFFFSQKICWNGEQCKPWSEKLVYKILGQLPYSDAKCHLQWSSLSKIMPFIVNWTPWLYTTGIVVLDKAGFPKKCFFFLLNHTLLALITISLVPKMHVLKENIENTKNFLVN